MTNSTTVVDPVQVLRQAMYSLCVCDLPFIRRAHTLPGMSGRAKPYVVNEESTLEKWQQADAARLKSAFVSWQRVCEAKGHSSNEFSQKAVAGMLGITQGALSQFLNAHTAIHPSLLLRICKIIEVDPGVISPSLAAVARQEAQAWGFAEVTKIHIPESLTGSRLGKTKQQKGKTPRQRQRG